MSIGDKVVNYISEIKKDTPRRTLAVLGFIFIGILTVGTVIVEFFYRFIKTFLEEIVLYSREVFPRVKSFFVNYMRLW